MRLLAGRTTLLLFTIALTGGCDDKPTAAVSVPRPVKTVTVSGADSWNGLHRVGEIRAHNDIALGFRLSGRLLSRSVEAGDRVQAGQVLATIESHTADNQRLSARADLDSARAAEQVAALTLRRMKLLVPGGAVSIAQLDTAQAEWQSAVSRRKSSEASLKIAEENVSWSRLIAPSGGVITAVSASAGQVVSAGQTIVTLAAGDSRDAVFWLPAVDDIRNRQSDTFSVSLLSAPKVVARGTLRDISPQADPDTRTWRVRITLIAPPPSLALGASVQTLFAPEDAPAIALPASSLTRIGGKPAVFVLDSTKSRLALTPVSLAGFSPQTVYIAGGLRPGDKVVTAGVSKLRDGEAVSATEETP